MSQNVRSQSPVRILRTAFSDSSTRELRKYATQRGFADLVGRSESLIRNIENGIIECSPKLAAAIASRTGVQADWLTQGKVTSDEIPSEDGAPWSPEMVLPRAPRRGRPETSAAVMSEASLRGVSPATLLLHMTRSLLVQAAEDGQGQFPDDLARLLKDFGMLPSRKGESDFSAAWHRFDSQLPRRDMEDELRDISLGEDT